MPTVSMKMLLEAGVHFGHQTRRWNPKMAKYIFGVRNNIHIIDLQKSVKELKKALVFVRDSAADGQEILFVGTKKQAQESIAAEASRCGSPYVRERWLGGTLTNFETVRRSAMRLQELERMKESGIFQALAKKEIVRREKEIVRLKKSLDGIKNMTRLPNIMFIVDPVQEMTALLEAKKMECPVVSICDTNCDPDLIDYPIPGNDDAIRSVRLFCALIADSILEGKQIAAKKGQDESAPEGTPEGAVSSADIAPADPMAVAPVVNTPPPTETTVLPAS